VLEVIFSIGIVAVGLLGTLTIIPVAGNRVTQGVIADNADRVGRTAIRQFDLRNMRQPNMWTRFNPTPTPAYEVYGVPWADSSSTGLGLRTSSRTYLWRQTTNDRWEARSFCIDPLFVAQNVANWQASTPIPYPQQGAYFPYFSPFLPNNDPAARMDRVSLRNYPGGPTGMSRLQAYQVFMAQDDLAFDLPEDETLVPEQKFDSSDAKRQFDGKYTWMATLTPKDSFALSNQVTLPTKSSLRTDLYVLSIIVFHRRDMSMERHYANPASEGPDPERLVTVDFRVNTANPRLPPPSTSTDLNPGAGIGGGNMWFNTIQQDRNGDGNPANDPHWAQDVEVRKGDWVMLSARVQPAGLAPVSVFRWYRVLSADEVVGNGPFARNVSLLGPDWTDVIQAQLNAGVVPMAQATLLNGVVAVYEKTIRLETSGMWTDL